MPLAPDCPVRSRDAQSSALRFRGPAGPARDAPSSLVACRSFASCLHFGGSLSEEVCRLPVSSARAGDLFGGRLAKVATITQAPPLLRPVPELDRGGGVVTSVRRWRRPGAHQRTPGSPGQGEANPPATALRAAQRPRR